MKEEDLGLTKMDNAASAIGRFGDKLIEAAKIGGRRIHSCAKRSYEARVLTRADA